MRWLGGVLAAVALVAAGCGGTTTVGAGGADIVPASAPAFIQLNVDTDSSQWQTLDRLASRFPDKPKLMKLFDSALESENLNWKRDVKPALGSELDFAWLDFDGDGQDFVVLMQPDNKQKFEKLIAHAKNDSDFFRAEIEGWQVMAPRQDVLDEFRQESSSGGTLTDRDAFVDAMDSYPDDYIFRAYVDGAAVMSAAKRIKDTDFQKVFPKLGRLDWFATDLRATSEGIRWDMNVHGTPGEAFKGIKAARTFSPALSREVPKDALAYFSFHGTKGMFRGMQNNPIFADVPEVKRYAGVFRQVGRLLEGENALWVRPSTSGKFPEVTFVAEPAAGTDGAATLDGLIKRYRKQMELPSLPTHKTIAGVDARVVRTGDDPATLYYANVGKRLVVSDFPSGITTLAGRPQPLTQSSEYQGARNASGMPDKTQGFVYVNIRGGMRYAQRLMGAPLPGEVKRNLRPLRSAVEYAATRPSEIQVTFFLRIK